jgi:PKD repeat protein
MEFTPPAQAGRRNAPVLFPRTATRGALALAAAGLVGLAACADNPVDVTPLSPGSVANASLNFQSVNPENQPFVEGQIIVRFTPGANRAQVAAGQGASIQRELLDERVFVLNVPAGAEKRIARALARNPNVEYAEPDYLLSTIPCETGQCLPLNDAFWGRKWDLHNDGNIYNSASNPSIIATTGRVDADIDWLEAYTHLENNGGVTGSAVIAILDTGIRSTHEDLAGKVIAGRNFTAGSAANWSDGDGHGTHVAGIAAAHSNNGVGVAGVGYAASIRLLAGKVCGNMGCPTSAIADGIRWAADNGAHVINMSLGGPNPQSPIQDAMRYADARNVLSICASGNDNRGSLSFPAGFPECVAVGATNWSDERASYSNFGPGLELTAPGGDSNPAGTAVSYIASAGSSNNTAYVYMAGTSMAAPQVAGLAGLIRAAAGVTNRAEIRTRLQETADDLGALGYDQIFGHGRINAYRAITLMDPVPPNRAPVASIAVTTAAADRKEGSAIQFNGSGSSDPDGDALTYLWAFGDGKTSTQMNPSHAYADDGTYTVRLTVSDGTLTHYAEVEVTVANVVPTATFNAPASPDQGSTWQISLTNAFDPSPADMAAGFTYRFDCGEGYGAWGTANSASCSTVERGGRTVHGEIRDKDGGSTEYSASVAVQAVGPTVSAGENATKFLGGTFWLDAGFTPVSDTDGPWSYTIAWGDGTTTAGTTTSVSAIQAGREYTSVGAHTVTVTVTDRDDASGTGTLTVQVNYLFAGFFNPVQMGGVLNRAKAGSAVPVKFSLNGNQGMNIFETGFPRPATIPCDASAGTNPVETITAGGSSLNYDASTGQYTYVWKTESSWRNSCRQLVVKLKDGTEHSANFQFTN